MKKIEIIINDNWKFFEDQLNENDQKKLNQKTIFKYNNKTTLFDLFKYLNSIYKDIILNFGGKDTKIINYKRVIRNRYRIFYKGKNIYLYDLNSKISSLIQLFNLDKIEIFFCFFTPIGGQVICPIKGMRFYMHSKENGKHKLPHIHVKYQDQEVVISLDGKILEGKIKNNMQKLARNIIIEDKESFLLKWNNMTDGEKFHFKNTELIRCL